MLRCMVDLAVQLLRSGVARRTIPTEQPALAFWTAGLFLRDGADFMLPKGGWIWQSCAPGCRKVRLWAFRFASMLCPRIWDWTWLHDGQVIRVSYRPGPDSGASIAYAAAPQGRLVHPSFPLVRSPAHAERPREHTHSVGSVEEPTSQRGRAPSASLLFCTAGMWTFGSRQNAFSPGTLRFTTALLSLCTGALVAAEYAVCLIRRHCLRTWSP